MSLGSRRRLVTGAGVISAAVLTGSLPAVASTRHRSGVLAPLDRPAHLTPRDALAALLAGNRRFVSGHPRYGHHVTAAAANSGGQEPDAVVLGCIDSRVPLEAIFDQNFGSICVVRSGGHVLDQAVTGSVEFAVSELHVPLVLVLGHERCGAVEATVTAARGGPRPGGALGYLVDAIMPSVLRVGAHHPHAPALALRVHVRATVAKLRAVGSGRVAAAESAGSIAVVGAVYDLDTGRVELLEPTAGS